ncbi:MAG TPA: thioredoxin family protein [Ktedonobacterales bacterium]|nr:thioredoxin family protein [Ktedonobacterales bacterium]
MLGDTLLRVAALLSVALLTWAIVAGVRAYAAARKRQALAAAPASDLPGPASAEGARVLAFSSEDCGPCHTLQRPALNRLLDARQGQVTVVEIDAPSSPELTRRYAVLTVPTTVVLDESGQARAINYGFAPLARLLAQVDEVLAASAA